MPRQNRVTPLGTIIADAARGTVMGNRGCLHDDGDQPLRQYQVRRWLICTLVFRNRRRTIMAPGQYTELFFLDEATALAAGHRPCYECNRTKFQAFSAHWSAANPYFTGGALASTDAIDEQLHRERLTDAYLQRDKRKRVYLDDIDGLPDGTFVLLGAGQTPHLVYGAKLLPWQPAGYSTSLPRPAHLLVTVLTPASTVRTLAHGYRPDLHATAEGR